mmetsp:Transcript_43942/g.77822  ORF Transcript_43942/g.77822 Transcript_43942/m.77822 type:complete len:487 (-) Transcript_43942:126-1586(-)
MIGKLVLALTLVKASYSEGDHGHGDAAFEWAGVFETPLDFYTWTAQKTGEATLAYVEPAMKLAAIPVAAATEAELHKAEAEGNHALQMANCPELASGSVIEAKADTCYTLKFEQKHWQSLYTVKTQGTAAVAFFTEHFPTEFENNAHYLKDPNAEDIEPVAELPEQEPAPAPTPAPEAEKKDTPWGEAIGAAIIVNIVTLVGVILAIPALKTCIMDNILQADAILSGFAAGAILACAFFLLLFESTHLVEEGWPDDEVSALWRWGTMILAGMALPSVVHAAVDFIPVSRSPTPAQIENQGELKEVPAMAERLRLIIGVNIGDFCHNFCDGLFLGFAFKNCGPSFGWSVLLGTVLHEIPQELADYNILTGPQVALSPLTALIINFVSGLSVILGTIIMLANEVGNEYTGLILACGGGVYIHVGAVECMPKIYGKGLSPPLRLVAIAAFIFGIILIGLVLLDHEHCVPPAPPLPPGAAPTVKPKGHHH